MYSSPYYGSPTRKQPANNAKKKKSLYPKLPACPADAENARIAAPSLYKQPAGIWGPSAAAANPADKENIAWPAAVESLSTTIAESGAP